jgi:hypothetical protein
VREPLTATAYRDAADERRAAGVADRSETSEVTATVSGSSPTRQLARERDHERHAERTKEPERQLGKDDE